MQCDLAIVGGGLVGASLACALDRQNIRVVLIDKINVLPRPLPLESRALALSWSTIQCLKALTIWPRVEAIATSLRQIHVSKRGYFGFTTLKAAENQLPSLGSVVDAAEFNHILNETLTTVSNLTIFRPDEILQFDYQESGWTLQLKSQQTVSCRLLVAADGAGSVVRQHQGIEVIKNDHRQTAIVANLELDQAHEDQAFERFTKEGSIAMLPFGREGNRVKSVWAVPTEKSRMLAETADSEFLALLQANFGYHLGRFRSVGKRDYYPLCTQSAQSIYDHRLVLVGNAANTLHPIAAQGFNLGLRDVATLAEQVVLAIQSGEDIGSIEVLRAYANARIQDHQTIRQLTAQLAKPKLLQWFGIMACQGLRPVKRWIMEKGLGRGENLPKLCRGVRLN